jgi:hypothetical protein
VPESYGLVPIGWVQSALRVLDDAPNQRGGAPRAWIRFDEQVAEGARDLRPGDEIVVLTWLHLSPRDELSTHPEDDMSQPVLVENSATSADLVFHAACRYSLISPASLVRRWIRVAGPGKAMTFGASSGARRSMPWP